MGKTFRSYSRDGFKKIKSKPSKTSKNKIRHIDSDDTETYGHSITDNEREHIYE